MTDTVLSKFLHLNKLGLTLPEDQRKYKRMTKSLYYREGFRLVTFGFVMSLYNLTNLPSPPHPTHKLMFYGGLMGAFGVASFIQESRKMNADLAKLDSKYEREYEEYIGREKEKERISKESQNKE